MSAFKTILGVSAVIGLIALVSKKNTNNKLKLISTEYNSITFEFNGSKYTYNHIMGDSKTYGNKNGLHLVVSSEFELKNQQNYYGVSFSIYNGNKVVGDMVKHQLYSTTK